MGAHHQSEEEQRGQNSDNILERRHGQHETGREAEPGERDVTDGIPLAAHSLAGSRQRRVNASTRRTL